MSRHDMSCCAIGGGSANTYVMFPHDICWQYHSDQRGTRLNGMLVSAGANSLETMCRTVRHNGLHLLKQEAFD